MKTERRLFELFVLGVGLRIYRAEAGGRPHAKESKPFRARRERKLLLADIKRVMETEQAQPGLLPVDDKRRIGSTELVRRLQSLPNSKWKKLGPVKLAKHMKQFDISPSSHRDGSRVFKGYRVGELLKAGL